MLTLQTYLSEWALMAVRGVEYIKAVELARTEKRMNKSKYISGAQGCTVIRRHTSTTN